MTALGVFLFPRRVGRKKRIRKTEMTTEEVKTEEVKPEVKEVSTAPAATPAEHMIPKSRLDEVLAKAEKAEKALLKFQEAEDKRKKDEMTEVERLKVERQEAMTKVELAEATLQAERTKYEVLAEAGKAQFGDKKLKFIDPNIAFRLLSDEDKAKGIVVALTELAKANPFLLEQPAANGDGVGSPKKNNQKSLDEKQPVYKIPRF